MQSQEEWGQPGTQLTDIVETRSGVVTVDQDAAIFGGGVFDGWVITDIHETETVIEPLSLSLLASRSPGSAGGRDVRRRVVRDHLQPSASPASR